MIFKYEKDNLNLKEQFAEVNRLLQKEQNKNKVMLNTTKSVYINLHLYRN